MRQRPLMLVALTFSMLMVPAAASAHEGQVIRLGSFLAGFTHPVLGLDHLLAMVSVGVVSAMIGGRAIWTVPATFVAMMAVGGLLGSAQIGPGSTFVEIGIAISVLGLGIVIAADRNLPLGLAMVVVGFFGLLHGYAHGSEIPNIAEPVVYAGGFLSGTAIIHLVGVLIGDQARRYRRGRPVLRTLAVGISAAGLMFLVGVL
ncbi:MAG: HupE/UreJ family protein [Acidimicrobiia bacterium]|nr:HupE/UreJ family protein [Acidimicrobiia bacterium]